MTGVQLCFSVVVFCPGYNMCLLVFAFECHRNYRLVMAANRDEYFDRPTLPADYWADRPDIIAGRDLVTKGTWLGVTRMGKIAAITNYRDPEWQVPDPISRGTLVGESLMSDLPAEEFLNRVKAKGSSYNYAESVVIYGRLLTSLKAARRLRAVTKGECTCRRKVLSSVFARVPAQASPRWTFSGFFRM